MCANMARDNHITQIYTFVALLLFVQAQNSGAPRITYSILEELAQNSYIGNIPQDAKLTDSYSQSIVDSFNFGILQGRFIDYFTVEDTTGILKTSSMRLDRESLCAFKYACKLTLDIGVVKPTQYFQVISVAINLDDKNDNPPLFPKPNLQLNISENASPGSAFVIPTAIDLDSGGNAVQGYEFISNTSKFELKVTKNVDESTDLRLMLKDRLDREHVSAYNLKVIAKDGGTPSQSGEIQIKINVVDSNDNSPVFDKGIYNATIQEDYPLYTPILQVFAYDMDTGPNGEIVYELSTQTIAQYGQIFTINITSGHISLISEVDYELETIYTLLVEAKDLGPDSLPAHAKVIINLLDVNDHQPKISINALTESGHAQISEWADTGTFVAYVAVEDLDKGASGLVDCVLQDGHFNLQKLPQYNGQYKILTAAQFDYEQKQIYHVLLVCEDKGVPITLRTTKDVAISVLDENDHAPQFKQGIYGIQMRENNSIDSVLVQVSATDADDGQNAKITYSLGEDSHGKVAIDKDTGTVSSNTVFDHEQLDSFVFKVFALDNGKPQLNATAIVSIAVIDINDEAPTFIDPSYTFGTFENQQIYTEIGSVMAEDPDSPPFDDFTMYLHPDFSDLDTFDINPQTGMIQTKKVLDREHQETYYLTVVAANTAFPHPSATVTVSIHVADKNDNAPSIYFPSLANDTAIVSGEAPPGYIVTNILAKDADYGMNSQLVYQIAKGNDEQLFAMDPATGAINVKGDLQKSTSNEVTLVVLVKDQGEIQKSAVASIDIQIDRENGFLGMSGADDGSGGLILGYHQKIIIILGCVTAFLVIVLLTAIIILKRGQAVQDKEDYKYVCRIDLAHRLCNSDDAASDAGGSTASDASIPGKTQKKSVSFDDTKERLDGDMYMTNLRPSKSHLTLEDLQRVRCLYRDVPPPPSANSSFEQGQGQGNSCAANQEMEVAQLLELIKREGCDPDSASAASNADSGRGTSESGDNHRITADINADTSLDLSAKSQRPVKGRQGHHPQGPPPRPPKKMPNTGCHGNSTSRTSSFTGTPCKVHPPPKYSSIGKSKPILQDYYPPRTVLPPTGGLRHNYVLDTESADNVSDGGSTTSGSYIVELDNGPLKAVDV